MNPITYPARPGNGGPLPMAIAAGAYKEPGWVFQPKINGWRSLLHTPTGTMWNRQLQPLSITNDYMEQRIALADYPFEWLDVECLGRRHAVAQDSIIILDWVVPDVKLKDRLRILERFLDPFTTLPNRFGMMITWPMEEAESRWENLQARNRLLGCTFYEGLVAKHQDSTYSIQLRSGDETCPSWTKHRFTTK